MGVLKGAAGSGFAGRLGVCLFVSIGCGPGPGGVTAAQAEALGPLEHHATVRNGRFVGSAFVISEGYALTNAHVVKGRRPGSRVHVTASGEGGAGIEARLLAVSPRMDLAVLEVPRGFAPVVSARNAPQGSGLAVAAAGIDASMADRRREPMQVGGQILSAWENIKAFGPGLIARLPGVRPGFSGGPLLDRAGHLVGMVTAIRPGRSGERVAASGREGAGGAATEAYVLRAAEIRAEFRRLTGAAQVR